MKLFHILETSDPYGDDPEYIPDPIAQKRSIMYIWQQLYHIFKDAPANKTQKAKNKLMKHKHLWAKVPICAFSYAKYVINNKFSEGESAIAMNYAYSYNYAFTILANRFPEGEPAIATNDEAAYLYAADVLRGRFKLGEPIIAKGDPEFIFRYAFDIMHGRFPIEEGEQKILQTKFANRYKEFINKIEKKKQFRTKYKKYIKN